VTDEQEQSEEQGKKAPVPPWGPVQPKRAFARPDGVWWARAGEIDRKGYGGWLCDVATHRVYLAERGEPNKRGERETFYVCDDCGAVHKRSKRR
jgi:hypothetical protein